ncbi:MAG: FecR family protein, partial [Clostridiales bacterium]|nr:FecR family protein [Clostridiales bacterium]
MKIKGKTLIIFVAVAAAAVVLVTVGVVRTRMSDSNETYRNVKVLETEGTAELTREAETMSVYEQMLIRGGDILVTGADGWVDLSLDDDKYAIVEPSSELEFELEGEKGNGAIRLHLNAGAIYNDIEDPISDGDSYEIETPDGVMAVRGTEYWIYIEILDAEGNIAKKAEDVIWRVTTIVVFEGSVNIQVKNSKEEQTVITAGKEAVIEKYYGDEKNSEEEARLRKSGGTIDAEKLPDYLLELYGGLLTGNREDSGEESDEDAGGNGDVNAEKSLKGRSVGRSIFAGTGSTTGDFSAGSNTGTNGGTGTTNTGTGSDDTGTGTTNTGTGTTNTGTESDDTGTGTNNTGTGSDDGTETAVELTQDDFKVDTSDQVYAGAEIEPSVSAGNTSMREGTDYTVTYSGNDGAGEATITVTGIGNYTGTLTYTFTITKGTVDAPSAASVTYDGTLQTADVAASALYEVT